MFLKDIRIDGLDRSYTKAGKFFYYVPAQPTTAYDSNLALKKLSLVEGSDSFSIALVTGWKYGERKGSLLHIAATEGKFFHRLFVHLPRQQITLGIRF
jgi:hypothetical protein